ncbi:hypothetical protein BST61_g11603 [Cercospora zeina]
MLQINSPRSSTDAEQSGLDRLLSIGTAIFSVAKSIPLCRSCDMQYSPYTAIVLCASIDQTLQQIQSYLRDGTSNSGIPRFRIWLHPVRCASDRPFSTERWPVCVS